MSDNRQSPRQLLSYQIEGVDWMRHQEADESVRGGILADDMGMGKTLQVVSLIAGDTTMKPNLIVCTLGTLTQWEQEIRHGSEKRLRCYLFHGPFQADAARLSKYDVVLTTYATLTSVFRRMGGCEWEEESSSTEWYSASETEWTGKSMTVRTQLPISDSQGRSQLHSMKWAHRCSGASTTRKRLC